MQSNTDQQLIDKTLRGNTRAYAVLVEKYMDFVFTIIVRMVKVKEEAEEVTQDTFIKAYESLDSFRGDSKFSSWLYRIAYRKALDSLRKNKHYQTMELEEEITSTNTLTIENALQQLVRSERNEKIRQCISQLPTIEAALVTWYYFEEQSVKEIAAITNLSEENVKVKLYRSRKKLFTLLQDAILINRTH